MTSLDKSYISPIDKLLYHFDKTHPKTPSQQKEIEKHTDIASRRDHTQHNVPDLFWEA